MDYFCRSCGKPILAPSTPVPCFGPCHGQFHPSCAGFLNLSANQIRYLVWLCDSCQRGLSLQRSELDQQIRKLCGGGREPDGAGPPLPTEMLEMIFRYLGFRDLTQVRLTCHRWKAVVDGSIYLMDEFVLHFPEGVTMDQDYEPDCLLTASGVSISKACIVTVGPWWSALGEKLVEIVLYNCSIALPELANMLRQTPNLQFLYIENLSCPETGDVPKLANFQLPRLEMFDLFDVDPSLLDLMLRVCTRLKHLGYDYYKTSIRLTNSNLRDVGRTLPELRELDVEMRVEPNGCISFLNTMPNLEKLDIFDVNNKVLIDFKDCRSPKLKNLELRAMQPSAWTDVCEYLEAAPHLDSVTLKSCKFNSWSELFRTLPMTRLRKLALESISAPPKSSVSSLFQCYDNLRVLKLSQLALPRKTMKVLFRLCPRLEKLSLTTVRTLDDSTVQELLKKLMRLAKLTIVECPVTDVAVAHIVDHCTAALERLEIERCPLLTQAARDLLERGRQSGKLRAIVAFKQ
ncbi:hypothetical protein pipiens_017645 [Culex pipiens pipiens]|uniref:F-box domain-containing protein n=1 Tax=Culex pipiens pipiens TaxID=38569 RepID=A0ABD1CFL7_CULPP